jgi:hypothetical protein
MPPGGPSPFNQPGMYPGMSAQSNQGMYPAGNMGMQPQPQGAYYPPPMQQQPASNKKFLWIVLALVAVGAGVGVSLAFLL